MLSQPCLSSYLPLRVYEVFSAGEYCLGDRLAIGVVGIIADTPQIVPSISPPAAAVGDHRYSEADFPNLALVSMLALPGDWIAAIHTGMTTSNLVCRRPGAKAGIAGRRMVSRNLCFSFDTDHPAVSHAGSRG